MTDFPIEVRREEERIHVDRWIMDGPPPPMFEKAGGISGDVDRWQLITWIPPSHILVDVGCAVAGTGARDGDRGKGVTMFSNHTLTPETETTCHYFWHHARDFKRDDAALTDYLRQATGEAFYEDVVIVEAQQKSLDSAPDDFTMIDINADAGVLQASRILDGLIAAEAE